MQRRIDVVRFSECYSKNPNSLNQLGWNFNHLAARSLHEIGVPVGITKARYGGQDMADVHRAQAEVQRELEEDGVLHSAVRITELDQYGHPREYSIGAIAVRRSPAIQYREPGTTGLTRRRHKLVSLPRACFSIHAFTDVPDDPNGALMLEALQQTLRGLDVAQGLGMYAVTMLQEEQIDHMSAALESIGLRRVGALGNIALASARQDGWPTNELSALFVNAPVDTTIADLAKPF